MMAKQRFVNYLKKKCKHLEITQDADEFWKLLKEEDGSEVEVMDLLFFYDRKKLDEDAIRQRINFFASETKCEVRVMVIKFDDVSQQKENG